MAGRRLRAAVKATLVEKGRGQFDSNTQVVIAGLAGDYSQYITTFEEFIKFKDTRSAFLNYTKKLLRASTSSTL